MKKLILFLIILGVTYYFTAPAFCWNCVPKRCSFDLECGLSCWCYKAGYDLQGVCVSE